MICPNCGRKELEGKKFCPACGLKLQAMMQVATKELSLHHPNKTSAPTVFTRKVRSHLLTSGFFIMMIGTMLGILGTKTLANHWLAELGAILAVTGIGLIGYYGIRLMIPDNEKPSLAKAEHQNHQTVKLPDTPPPMEIESITEHTTRELNRDFNRSRKTPIQDSTQR